MAVVATAVQMNDAPRSVKEFPISQTLADDSRCENLDPKDCPPQGRKSHPSYLVLSLNKGGRTAEPGSESVVDTHGLPVWS